LVAEMSTSGAANERVACAGVVAAEQVCDSVV
jgi:hypothetical protein